MTKLRIGLRKKLTMNLARARTGVHSARANRIKGGIAAIGVAGIAVGLAPVAAGSAATVSASGVPVAVHGPTTETFGFTGAPVVVRVPDGAAGVMVTATGGGGGKGWAGGNGSGSPAGSGGIATGFAFVRPGEQAEITVGGKGADMKADPGWGGAFGGGRGGSHSGLGGPGGGGGGASTFSLEGRLLIVAGAGGGGGAEGALAGLSGGRGGSGVLAPSSGAGGNGSGGTGAGAGGGGAGSARTSTNGGDGGNGGSLAGGGGGGGGGLRAGDGGGGGRAGGGGGGGGGAGGSAVESPAGGASFATAKDPANGQVTLTWLTSISVSCLNLTRAVGSSALSFKLDCSPVSTALTYSIVTGPAHGAIGVDPQTGALAYTPRSGFTGTDSFTYTATNGIGQTAAPATVTLLIVSAAAVISDASTGLIMDGRGLTNPGSPIAGSVLGQGVTARWHLKNNANGTVSIINATSGLCAGPVGGAAEPGVPLQQQTCDGATSQQFTAAPEPGGVRIFAASGFPLVFRSGAPGTPLTIGELNVRAIWQLR
jgi:hypothetical protein